MNRIFIMLLALAWSAVSFAASPVGYWKTIDDETGNPKSVVHITQGADGTLSGQIVKLYRQPDEEADPICDKCEGAKHNQKTNGMVIMTGLTKDDDEWSGGTILDPAKGAEYSCYIEMESDNKLKLRGYLGISLLGRTQYWHRVEQPTDKVEYLK